MENSTRALPRNHPKQAQLAFMERGTCWETACHQVHQGGRGAWVEAHKLLEGHLVVVIEGSKLNFAEDQGGKAAQEDWEPIELLDFEGGSWVALVASGKAGREDSMEGTGVGADPGKNCCHAARAGGPRYSHMLGLCTERYWKALHINWFNSLPIASSLLLAFRSIAEQLRLGCHHLNMMACSIL